MQLESQCIALLASTTKGVSNRGPSLMALLFSLSGVPWRNFPKSAVVHAKMGHKSQTRPLSGVMYHVIGKTLYSLPVYKI